MKALFVLILGFGLAGCATGDVEPVVSWQQGQSTASTDAVSTPVKANGQAYIVQVACVARTQNAPHLRLTVTPKNGQAGATSDADSHARTKPGSIRFGHDSPHDITWQRTGATARADSADNTLAEGLAQVFKTHRKITLGGLTPGDEPLRFTFGQGPYEPIVSNFLVGCPPTHDLMPKLVRIRRSTLKPTPKGDDAPKASNSNNLLPAIPDEVWDDKESGKAKVVASLTPDGHVLWPVITKSSGYAAIDRSALGYVKALKFPKQPLAQNELYIIHRALKISPNNSNDLSN